MGLSNQILGYTVGDKLYEGDIADIYGCTIASRRVLLKIARDKTDNDLLESEAITLNALYPAKAREEKFFRYIPKIIDSFVYNGLRANVLPPFDGYVTLEQIIKAFPDGIDFRDMVWMYKRLLVGIGYAHTQGVIHGAVVPSHVLVHPTEHGAKLIGWGASLNFAPLVATDAPKTDPADPKKNPKVARSVWERVHDLNLYDDGTSPQFPRPRTPTDPAKMFVKVISVAHDKFYPQEVLDKQTPTPATDVYMAAKCAIAILGGDPETNLMPNRVPAQIQAFLKASVLGSPRKRPQDAWDVHEDFDKLLLKLVGQPTYRPFAMPPKS